MRYKVKFTAKADKMLAKMDFQIHKRIRKWIREHLDGCENPRLYGKALTGNFQGNWRYEVSDYRIIAEIHDDTVIILITKVGHRKEIYRAN